MRHKTVFVVLLVLMSFSATAFTASQGSYRDANLKQFKDSFNSANDQLPGFVQSLVGDQRVNVVIRSESSEDIEIGAVMNGTRIQRLENHTVEDPTLSVKTDRKTVQDIYDSRNPFETVKKKIENDRIQYEAHGFFNQVQVFFLEFWAGL